jgi:hypothetical protein
LPGERRQKVELFLLREEEERPSHFDLSREQISLCFFDHRQTCECLRTKNAKKTSQNNTRTNKNEKAILLWKIGFAILLFMCFSVLFRG